MSRPKISLIVPIYNTAQYLPRCLDSLIGQTFGDLEIILVNDGSTDQSLDICLAYAEKDKRIQVLDQANGGVASARNAALDRASGDLIGFVDSDDYIAPGMFEGLREALENSGADIAECGYWRMDEKDQPLKKYALIPSLYTGREEIALHYAKKDNGYYFCCNKLYRSALIQELRFPPLRYSEDYLFNAEAHGRCRKKVCIEDPAYFYIEHPKSVTRIPFKEAKLDIIKAGQAVYDHYQREGLAQLLPYAALYTAWNARHLYEQLKKSKIREYRPHGPYLLGIFRENYDKAAEALPRILPSKRKRLGLKIFRISPSLYRFNSFLQGRS